MWKLIENLTEDEKKIFAKGLQVLEEKLGGTDAGYFISIVNRNKFDYTEWQKNLFAGMNEIEFDNALMEYAKNHNLEWFLQKKILKVFLEGSLKND